MTLVINKGPVLGMRHIQAALLFLNITVLYVVRLSIGVAIVAMTNAETTNPNFQEFDWNEKKISYILSSFFLGYASTQIIGGQLCKRFGVKCCLGLTTLMSGLLCTITPWAVVKNGWTMFCTLRILLGLLQGVLMPAVHTHLANWSPLEERNRLGALSHAGVDCGTVLALSISGIIAEGPMGWPGIFYVNAVLCCVWCILWFIFGYNTAMVSRFITKAEQDYIEVSLGRASDFHKKPIPIPWKAILTSIPFLAFTLLRCTYIWGLSITKHQIPSYFHGVFNLKIKHNGFFSALPFLIMWLFSYVCLIIADILQRKQLMSTLMTRRIFSTISSWLPAIGFIAIGFVDNNNKTIAIMILTILMGFNGANILGSSFNNLDLSPNHAGILVGITNTLASCVSIITPLVVASIVTDTHDRFQWQIVFAIAAGMLFFGNLIYITLGTTDTQPWDAEDYLIKNHIRKSNTTDNNNIKNDNSNSSNENIENNL